MPPHPGQSIPNRALVGQTGKIPPGVVGSANHSVAQPTTARPATPTGAHHCDRALVRGRSVWPVSVRAMSPGAGTEVEAAERDDQDDVRHNHDLSLIHI